MNRRQHIYFEVAVSLYLNIFTFDVNTSFSIGLCCKKRRCHLTSYQDDIGFHKRVRLADVPIIHYPIIAIH